MSTKPGDDIALRLDDLSVRVAALSQHQDLVARMVDANKRAIVKVKSLRKCRDQLEYYWSDENLRTDLFLLEKIASGNGWVTAKCMATFKKLARLAGGSGGGKPKQRTIATIVQASRMSPMLVVEGNKKTARMRRAIPLPEDSFNIFRMLERTVVCRRLPSASSPGASYTPAMLRKRIFDKHQSKTSSSTSHDNNSAPIVERVFFARSNETPQEVLSSMMRSSGNMASNVAADAESLGSGSAQASDDARGVNTLTERAAFALVLAYSETAALDVVSLLDEPNNWRGGMRVEMLIPKGNQKLKQREKAVAKAAPKPEGGATATAAREGNSPVNFVSDDAPRGPAPGFVIVSKPDKRFGFVATTKSAKKGTYFRYDHVVGTADIWDAGQASFFSKSDKEQEELTNKTGVFHQQKTENDLTALRGFKREKNIVLKKGDHVIYSVMRDARTGKLRAADICRTAGPSPPPLEESILSSAPRIIQDEEKSNEERKKYLRERRRMLALRNAGKGQGGLLRAQKSGCRRNQFGEEQDSNLVTSGGLLDIVGRDAEDLVPVADSHAGKEGSKGGGKSSMANGGKPALGWTILTAKGPDGTRGFSDEYQKSRGKFVRTMCADAIEFVPLGF